MSREFGLYKGNELQHCSSPHPASGSDSATHTYSVSVPTQDEELSESAVKCFRLWSGITGRTTHSQLRHFVPFTRTMCFKKLKFEIFAPAPKALRPMPS